MANGAHISKMWSNRSDVLRAVASGRHTACRRNLGGSPHGKHAKMARALGVNRTPVREALQRPAARFTDGGSGSALAVQLTKQRCSNYTQCVEILKAPRRVHRSTHRPKLNYQRCRRNLQARDAVGWQNLIADFIKPSTGHQSMLQTLDSLHDSLALLHGTVFRMPNRRTETDEEHRLIVAAIERRDSDAAERAAREHIKQAQRTRFDLAIK